MTFHLQHVFYRGEEARELLQPRCVIQLARVIASLLHIWWRRWRAARSMMPFALQACPQVQEVAVLCPARLRLGAALQAFALCASLPAQITISIVLLFVCIGPYMSLSLCVKAAGFSVSRCLKPTRFQ